MYKVSTNFISDSQILTLIRSSWAPPTFRPSDFWKRRKLTSVNKGTGGIPVQDPHCSFCAVPINSINSLLKCAYRINKDAACFVHDPRTQTGARTVVPAGRSPARKRLQGYEYFNEEFTWNFVGVSLLFHGAVFYGSVNTVNGLAYRQPILTLPQSIR